MSATQAEFRARLELLVNKFKANAGEYLANDYAEAQARQQFIDPLFVERMLELHRGLAQASASADRDLYQRQFESHIIKGGYHA